MNFDDDDDDDGVDEFEEIDKSVGSEFSGTTRGVASVDDVIGIGMIGRRAFSMVMCAKADEGSLDSKDILNKSMSFAYKYVQPDLFLDPDRPIFRSR